MCTIQTPSFLVYSLLVSCCKYILDTKYLNVQWDSFYRSQEFGSNPYCGESETSNYIKISGFSQICVVYGLFHFVTSKVFKKSWEKCVDDKSYVCLKRKSELNNFVSNSRDSTLRAISHFQDFKRDGFKICNEMYIKYFLK